MVSSLSSDTSFKLSSSHSHNHVWHKWVAFSQAIQTPNRVNFILSDRKSGGCLWCQPAFLGILTWWSPLFYTLMLKPSRFSSHHNRYLMVFTYLVYMCVWRCYMHVCVALHTHLIYFQSHFNWEIRKWVLSFRSAFKASTRLDCHWGSWCVSSWEM